MDTLLTAHAGADETPDNSWPSIYHALTLDTDMFEADIRRDAEGALVLGHDSAEQGAPKLSAVFQLLEAYPLRMNCDLKEAGLEAEVARLAQEAGVSEKILFSGTVDPARTPQDIEIYWNIEECVPGVYERCMRDPEERLPAAELACARCRDAGISVLNVYEKLADEKFLDILARHGIGASVWTVNDEKRIRWFLEKGVHNVTTRLAFSACALRRPANTVPLLEQVYHWQPGDSQTDVPFSFVCPADIRRLVVRFGYAPGKEYAEEICLPEIERALARYYDRFPREMQPMDAKQFMPIKNLVTLSLSREGTYIGNAHRWAPRQTHTITAWGASLGFTVPERVSGRWEGLLHLHEILSPMCEGHLTIEGRRA